LVDLLVERTSRFNMRFQFRPAVESPFAGDHMLRIGEPGLA
jgi:hypothetical protein